MQKDRNRKKLPRGFAHQENGSSSWSSLRAAPDFSSHPFGRNEASAEYIDDESAPGRRSMARKFVDPYEDVAAPFLVPGMAQTSNRRCVLQQYPFYSIVKLFLFE